MRTSSISLLLFAASSACSNAQQLGQEAVVPDLTAPWLDVRTPLRGTFLHGEAATLEVRGYVQDDDALLRVTVNGQTAQLAADGTFTVAVRATPGLTLLHTVVTDRAGNSVSDTRAVLGGELVRADTPSKDAILARLDARAIRAGGELVAQRLGTTAFREATLAKNPIFNEPLPCVGARADASSVSHGAVKLLVTPVDGGLYVDARVPDLVVGLQVGYAASCSSARSETTSARASAFHLRGLVRLGIGDDGLMTLDRSSADAELVGFALADSKLPGAVVTRIEDSLADTLTELVAEELAAHIPSAILSGLGTDRKLDVGGENGLELALRPTQLSFDSKGVSVTLDSAVRLRGGGEALYLPTAAPRPTLDGRREMALAIADDSMNQIVSSLWSVGGFEQSIAPVDAELAAIFDTIQLYPRLPPMVSALPGGEGLAVTVGDVECLLTRRLEGGAVETVARLALSAEILATVRVAGQDVSLSPRTPRAYLDVLRDGRDEAAPPLTAAQLSRLRAQLAGVVLAKVAEGISYAPLPASVGEMVAPSFFGASPEHGYVIVTADLEWPQE